MDGRSDVNGHFLFMIISNCCRTDCGHTTWISGDQQRSMEDNQDQQRSKYIIGDQLRSTKINHYQQKSTKIIQDLPRF